MKKEKAEGILVRILTKDKGLNQRFFEGLTMEDVVWCEVFESTPGRIARPQEVLCSYYPVTSSNVSGVEQKE
jgi:hypothetical protein